MSEFIIFDDKDENWKNSEVMRLFVNNYMQVKTAQDNTNSTESVVEQAISDNKIGVDKKPVELDIKLAMQAEVNNILYQLNELAKESIDSGNEKATIMIEVAALKIKDLLNGDDE